MYLYILLYNVNFEATGIDKGFPASLFLDYLFQARDLWSPDLNRTVTVNETIAMASTTELRSDPLYSQVRPQLN